MNELYKLEEVSSIIESKINILCSSGFDSRCTAFPKSVDKSKINSLFIIKNRLESEESEKYYKELQSVSDNYHVSNIISDDPLVLFDLIHNEVMPKILGELEVVKQWYLDITSFSHEQLLVILHAIQRFNLRDKFKFVYVGADQYCPEEKEELWLSKGVVNIRTVMGYPGLMLPSRRLHLILMVGFEDERAKEVIRYFEPSKLTIGYGSEDGSVQESHYKKNKEFFNKVSEFADSLELQGLDVETFEFSCIDPIQVQNTLGAITKKNEDFNNIICPLNTKISTLACGFFAYQEHFVQLCYPEALEYNVNNYATPSDSLRVLS